MNAVDIYLCVLGGAFVTSVVVRLFVPFFLISKSVQNRIETRNTTKGFLVSHNINGLMLGITLIVAGILPEQLKLLCCLPVMGGILVSVIICNIIFTGSAWLLF